MATDYEAPEYLRPMKTFEVAPNSIVVNAYSGNIVARLTVTDDTMKLAKIPSLAVLTDGWIAVENIDTHASAPTSDIALTLTDGTLTYTLLASIGNGNSGAQAFTRLSELTNALGTQLVATNRSWWDLMVTATTGAATAGTAGILRCHIAYNMDDGYAL